MAFSCSGSNSLPPVDTIDPENVSSRRKNHQEDHHDAEQDEGVGPEGALLQVAAGQRLGHGRRLSAVVCSATLTHSPTSPFTRTASTPRYHTNPRVRIYEGHIRYLSTAVGVSACNKVKCQWPGKKFKLLWSFSLSIILIVFSYFPDN